ncbi:DUF4129 domain-containing protein [Microlunatus sp. Y2014]|uniref:DUF4129 domain-containing protein n=1 Tax=Microlunatus sp. Y2014 TaxID=3418488 RepID=UPI003DA78FC1
MGAPIEIGAEEARRRAAEELAKAKYQGMPDWLADLLARLEFLLEQLTSPDRTPTAGDGPGNWVLLVVLLVILAGIALIVWRVGIPRWRSRVPDAEVEVDPEQSPDDYRTAAQAAADAGDWVTAIRERFRALIRELEEHTILDPRAGRTALEVAGTAARLMPEADQPLHRAALLFNDVMYGDVVADRAMYEEMASSDATVRAVAEQFKHPDVTDDEEQAVSAR